MPSTLAPLVFISFSRSSLGSVRKSALRQAGASSPSGATKMALLSIILLTVSTKYVRESLLRCHSRRIEKLCVEKSIFVCAMKNC